MQMAYTRKTVFDFPTKLYVNFCFEPQDLVQIRPLAERLMHNDFSAKVKEWNRGRKRLRRVDMMSYPEWSKTEFARRLDDKLLQTMTQEDLAYWKALEHAYDDYVVRFRAKQTSFGSGRPLVCPPEPLSINAAYAQALRYMCDNGTMPPLPPEEEMPEMVAANESARWLAGDGQLDYLYSEE